MLIPIADSTIPLLFILWWRILYVVQNYQNWISYIGLLLYVIIGNVRCSARAQPAQFSSASAYIITKNSWKLTMGNSSSSSDGGTTSATNNNEQRSSRPSLSSRGLSHRITGGGTNNNAPSPLEHHRSTGFSLPNVSLPSPFRTGGSLGLSRAELDARCQPSG